MKLYELTPEQQAKLIEFRAEVFAQATSTEPADRVRAEKAARRMAEIAGVTVNSVVWVDAPSAGRAAVDTAWASLWDSLSDSLRDSLWDSLSDSLWASPWQAFYAFPMLHMGVEYPPDMRKKLELHREIGASCFALWIVPGTVILCERPATVEIVDGRLIDLTWRDATGGGK